MAVRDRNWPFRSTAAAIFALGLVAGTSGAAFASAGCNAVNAGGFNASNTTNTSATIVNFAVGDTVSFTLNFIGPPPPPPPPFGTISYSFSTGDGTQIAGQSAVSNPLTVIQSYTVTGNHQDTTLNLAATASLPFIDITATCAAPASNTDSQKLEALEVLITKLVATSSGAAITGAVDGAIDDAFGNGGNPITAGPNGVTLNFAAEPESDVASRAGEAFSALGYAPMAVKAPPPAPLDREWSLWANVRGTGWNGDQTGDGIKGGQVNATVGLSRKLTPDFLVGVVAGYENFNYDVAALTGTMKGDGGTAGLYAAWRILPKLRWDTTLAWSDIAYNGTAGTASGSFTGSRWLASTGLTGSYGLGTSVFEPSAKLYALWENDSSFTDSLGTPQTARSFSAGMASAGGKLIYPWLAGNGARLLPYAGLYGDFRFATDTALPAGQPVVGFGDGWSARVTGGMAYTAAGGGSLSLGGEYGGLGANYKIWTARLQGSVPF